MKLAILILGTLLPVSGMADNPPPVPVPGGVMITVDEAQQIKARFNEYRERVRDLEQENAVLRARLACA